MTWLWNSTRQWGRGGKDSVTVQWQQHLPQPLLHSKWLQKQQIWQQQGIFLTEKATVKQLSVVAIGNGQQHCKRGTRVYLRMVLHESGIFSISMHMCILENKDKKSTLLYVYYESYHHTVRTFQALISPHCYNMEKERKIFVEWSRDNSILWIKSIQSLFSYFQQYQKHCSWL